jgi:hypothetical protein
MRRCGHAVVALALLLGVIMVAGNSSSVAADSCVAQLSNSSLAITQYYDSNGQIVVPVSATCAFSGYQLYAEGNIYDVSTNSNLTSTSTILTSINGGNVFNGQLIFNLPPLSQNDVLQISVSIYSNGFNDSLLTSVSQTVQVVGANYYTPPAYPGNYWYYPSYPSYQWSPSYPSYQPNPSPPPDHHDYDHSTPPSSPPGNHDNPRWNHNDPTPPSTPPTPPQNHNNPTPPSTPPSAPPAPRPITCPSGQHLVGQRCVPNN